jgi:hypothetical protein
MNPQSLRSSSFVAYFSHLPPQEAIQRCANLKGAAEICSDVDNWKAYVAKRYGLKYSLQRPDLTTAEEWQQQALALEISTDPKINGHLYYAGTYNGGETRLFPYGDRRQHIPPNIGNAHYFFRIKLYVVGLPIIVLPETTHVTFHVGSFKASNDDLDVKASAFESATLSYEWLLELFIPTYENYVAWESRIRSLVKPTMAISSISILIERSI